MLTSLDDIAKIRLTKLLIRVRKRLREIMGVEPLAAEIITFAFQFSAVADERGSPRLGPARSASAWPTIVRRPDDADENYVPANDDGADDSAARKFAGLSTNSGADADAALRYFKSVIIDEVADDARLAKQVEKWRNAVEVARLMGLGWSLRRIGRQFQRSHMWPKEFLGAVCAKIAGQARDDGVLTPAPKYAKSPRRTKGFVWRHAA